MCIGNLRIQKDKQWRDLREQNESSWNLKKKTSESYTTLTPILADLAVRRK